MIKPEVKAGKCNSFKAIYLSSEFQEKSETMTHICKHRKAKHTNKLN